MEMNSVRAGARQHPNAPFLTAILVVAIAARLAGIASRPLWYDEAFSVLFSEKGPATMLVSTLSSTRGGAAEEHPLAYYLMLWEWMRMFGESLIAVRLLSVLGGVLLVGSVYLLASDLLGNPTALVAAAIAALSPFQVHYGQEIRMYVFLALWLLLATYAYHRAAASGNWKWWAAFALFAALAQYTHNLAAFYLTAAALWPLLANDWRALKSVFLAGCVALVLYLPWLIHLPAQFAKVGQTYWIEKPALYRILTLLLTFVTNLPLPGWLLVAGLFVSLSLVALALIQTLRAARSRFLGVQAGLWLLYLSFAPPILLFLFSQWKPIYLERALLPSGAIFCIWLAWALVQTRMARPMQYTAAALLGVAFTVGIYEHITYAGFPYAPYESMLKHVEDEQQLGDVIIHSSKLSMLPSAYYDRGLAETYIADPPGSPQDTLARGTQQVLGLEAQPDLQTAAGSAARIWFIIFRESNQEYVSAGYPEHPQLSWLRAHYSQIDLTNWGDLHVYLFSATPQGSP